eukprot:1182614-Prorocentrum_minimum.AAC.1
MATWLSALSHARLHNAPAARVFPSASPVRSSCTSRSTAPARMMATLLAALFVVRLNNAPAA